jgi:hypothetical protein
MSSDIDGWYLMTPDEVAREVNKWKTSPERAFAGLTKLSVDEAIAFRNAGNVPDASGRSLRLVITVDPAAGVDSVAERRVTFEPDFHEAPDWRRPGSKPVNVVPLRERSSSPSAQDEGAWWDDAQIAPLEAEWKARGTVAGLPVPGEFRSFVYKTVIALQAAGKQITADSVADSVARWVPPKDADRLREALRDERAEG